MALIFVIFKYLKKDVVISRDTNAVKMSSNEVINFTRKLDLNVPFRNQLSKTICLVESSQDFYHKSNFNP